MDLERASRKVAYLLRHAEGFTDEHGWAKTSCVVQEVRKNYPGFNAEDLKQLVREDKKGRYSFDIHGLRIRANQGHSVPVDVELQEAAPPEILYHGTADRFVSSIFKEGLTGQTRLYVHLSQDVETAVKVGSRHGKPVVLKVAAGRMQRDGHVFWLSENGVWLAKAVPPAYLEAMWERSEQEGAEEV